MVRDGPAGRLRAVGCVTDITEFRSVDPGPAPALPAPRGRPAPTGLDRAAGPLAHCDAVNADLTNKERECLRWVSAGKTAWETSVILGCSPRTVEFHLRNAAGKLNAGNKVHAAAIAIRLDLL